MIAKTPYPGAFWASPELRGPPDLRGFSRIFLSSKKPHNRGGILYRYMDDLLFDADSETPQMTQSKNATLRSFRIQLWAKIDLVT